MMQPGGRWISKKPTWIELNLKIISTCVWNPERNHRKTKRPPPWLGENKILVARECFQVLCFSYVFFSLKYHRLLAHDICPRIFFAAGRPKFVSRICRPSCENTTVSTKDLLHHIEDTVTSARMKKRKMSLWDLAIRIHKGLPTKPNHRDPKPIINH